MSRRAEIGPGDSIALDTPAICESIEMRFKENRVGSRVMVLALLLACWLPARRAANKWLALQRSCEPKRQVTCQPKVTSETITVDWRKQSLRLEPILQRAVPCKQLISAQLAALAASRWSAVVGSFGLSASEGQFNRCPVPHPIPVSNQGIQDSRKTQVPRTGGPCSPPSVRVR